MNQKEKHQSPFNLNGSKLCRDGNQVMSMEGCGVDRRVSMKTVNKVKMTIVMFFYAAPVPQRGYFKRSKRCISSTLNQAKEKPDEGHQLLPAQL